MSAGNTPRRSQPCRRRASRCRATTPTEHPRGAARPPAPRSRARRPRSLSFVGTVADTAVQAAHEGACPSPPAAPRTPASWPAPNGHRGDALCLGGLADRRADALGERTGSLYHVRATSAAASPGSADSSASATTEAASPASDASRCAHVRRTLPGPRSRRGRRSARRRPSRPRQGAPMPRRGSARSRRNSASRRSAIGAASGVARLAAELDDEVGHAGDRADDAERPARALEHRPLLDVDIDEELRAVRRLPGLLEAEHGQRLGNRRSSTSVTARSLGSTRPQSERLPKNPLRSATPPRRGRRRGRASSGAARPPAHRSPRGQRSRPARRRSGLRRAPCARCDPVHLGASDPIPRAAELCAPVQPAGPRARATSTFHSHASCSSSLGPDASFPARPGSTSDLREQIEPLHALAARSTCPGSLHPGPPAAL